MADTRFAMDGQTDGWLDFNMPPEVPSGHKNFDVKLLKCDANANIHVIVTTTALHTFVQAS